MKPWVSFTVCVGALSLTIGMGVGVAIGQQAPRGRVSPPTQFEGRGETLATIDLGPEFDAMRGYRLRLLRVTYAPGAAGPMHNHVGSPVAVHILQGTLTSRREDGSIVEWNAGQSFTAGKEATHWDENRGTTPLVFIQGRVDKIETP